VCVGLMVRDDDEKRTPTHLLQSSHDGSSYDARTTNSLASVGTHELSFGRFRLTMIPAIVTMLTPTIVYVSISLFLASC